MKKLLCTLCILFVLCLCACHEDSVASTEPSSTSSSTTQTTVATEPPTTKAPEPTPTTQAPTEATTQDFVPPEGTPLEAIDLERYQQLFSRQFDRYARHPKNWYNTFLCVSFASPEEIDWNELFHSGTGFAQEPLTDAEEAFLNEQEGFPPEMDRVRIPADEMDTVAQQYLGLTPAESNKVGMENLTYFAQTDCYYRMVSDAQGIDDFVIHSGAVLDNGDIRLYYTKVGFEEEWVITLQSRLLEGETGYRILSNLRYVP